MARRIHIDVLTVVFFLGMTFPLAGFSQQDTPKRVSVVVKAKEIAADEQVVQLPADNLPTVISRATINKVRATEKTSAKTPKNELVQPPITAAKAKPAKSHGRSTPAKPIDNSANRELTIGHHKGSAVNSSDSIAPSNDVAISKTVQQVGDKTITTIKAKKENKELATFTHSSKVNSISYIWIGCFLIIAGVVLGLLFGRPAFLISFVGLVFITLGLLI